MCECGCLYTRDCCCCFSLKSGGLIIGYILAILMILQVTGTAVYGHKILVISSGVATVIAAVLIVCWILGIHTDSRCLMLPLLIVTVLGFIIVFIANIALPFWLIFNFHDEKRRYEFKNDKEAIIVFIIACVVMCIITAIIQHFVSVMYSLYKSMGESHRTVIVYKA